MHHKLDTCDLDRLIKSTYGVNFNSAYTWIAGYGHLDAYADKEPAESDEWIRQKLKDADNGIHGDGSEPPLVEVVLSDLCSKGLLEEGDYILVLD